MRAIVQDRYGDAACWRLGEQPRPEPGPDEALVEVRAAGLDRGTWHLMTGLPYLTRLGFGLRRPRTAVPGLDVAGVVAAVGSSVTGLAPGDEVFGVAKGSFAQYAVAEQGKLAYKPASLVFPEAAVVPVSGITALEAVRGRVEGGDRVLVLGASGGVGTYAVQLAAARGATVTGVCSAGKADLVRSIGAERVLDYRGEVFTGERYDVIIDAGGRNPLRRLRRALATTGTFVIVGGEGGGRWTGGFGRGLRAAALSPLVRQRLVMLVAGERAADLVELARLIDDGAVTPVLDRTYPLAEAAEAMRRLESGLVQGKVAITM
jgi:NADPH:quinone reductase-like Zn-dependent oxidoreductase